MAVDPHTAVRAMASIRFLSSAIECAAAILMLRLGIVGAVRLNAGLGLVGPTVFTVVSAFGIAGLAGRIAPLRLILVFAGVALVFLATRID